MKTRFAMLGALAALLVCMVPFSPAHASAPPTVAEKGCQMAAPTPKLPRDRSAAYGLCYASVLPQLQQIAREHGYALAVHGSMRTDLDLIACPWTAQASDAATLVNALHEAVSWTSSFPKPDGPERKPHGRLAWSITGDLIGPVWIDVSVMPRRKDTA